MHTTASPLPGRHLLLQVRTGFILGGTTLAAWCRDHNQNASHARQAVLGAWDGPKGRALRHQLVAASGAAAATSRKAAA